MRYVSYCDMGTQMYFSGCKVMVASRKIDKLSESAQILKSQIKPGSTAELDHLQCNIRNEEQVSH